MDSRLWAGMALGAAAVLAVAHAATFGGGREPGRLMLLATDWQLSPPDVAIMDSGLTGADCGRALLAVAGTDSARVWSCELED